MAPDHVVLEVKDEQSGEDVKKTVYVTEVNGTRTLDLYSGWNPETHQHKLPLKHLPSKVCSLVTLERLWVSHNKLSSLPPTLPQLHSLKELFLHRNNFDTIPDCIFSLPSLEILWLSCNKILFIPDTIANSKTLKRLHLDGNYIKEVPSSLCQVETLEVLYLNENTLHSVSDDIRKLKNLKRLYFQQNKISDIPPGLCQLRGLKMLNLDNNDIRYVEREFLIFQNELESNGCIVSTRSNPFVTHSRLKQSIGMLPQHKSLGGRRHSDQYESDLLSRRPLRVSLPGGRSTESLPDEALTRNMHMLDFNKADTLPRSSTVSVMNRGGTSYED